MLIPVILKQFSAKELQKIKAQVLEIGATRVDGHFLDVNGEPAQGSQAVSDFLERILSYMDGALERLVTHTVANRVIALTMS